MMHPFPTYFQFLAQDQDTIVCWGREEPGWPWITGYVAQQQTRV